MRTVNQMNGNTLKSRIKNKIHEVLEVAPKEDKTKEICLRWFSHVCKRPINAIIKKIDSLKITDTSRERKFYNDLVQKQHLI